jgi:aminoglycoside phosphotransferase family enzyme/predicted kinase
MTVDFNSERRLPADAAAGSLPASDPARQERLVKALCRVLSDEPGSNVRMLQTHISYVVLSGRYAYKIKKAVTLSFVDFSSLSARRHYCDEELRLNRRFAPQIYRRVVPITGTVDTPSIDAGGTPLEYAVEMVEFSQDALLAKLSGRGALTAAHMEALAQVLATFHQDAAAAAVSSPFGTAEQIARRALENFTELAPLAASEDDRQRLARLERWTRQELKLRRDVMEQRRATQRIRDCHGDLHLGNIVLQDGQVVLFDCLEFNDELRNIDVVSEIAFAVMDVEARGHAALAHRLCNSYFEATGDYQGLAVLRFYLVYRALVRAKIAAIRAAQLTAGDERSRCEDECSAYLSLGCRYVEPNLRGIIITHGLSGSGKTFLSQRLQEAIGAIRIRSDVERKRIHGLAAFDRSGSSLAAGLYGEASTAATYHRLGELAACITHAGYPVIIDATFLRRGQRDSFRDMAAGIGVPFAIVTFDAPVEELRRRIVDRDRQRSDASEANLDVLDRQLADRQPLGANESAQAVRVDTCGANDDIALDAAWASVERMLRGPRLDG